MNTHELAWAAGFFDGEGWANTTRMGRGDKRRLQARVNQAGGSGVPAALSRFRDAVGGLGRIGGPHREEGREDLYWWGVSSRADVRRLLDVLRPWLSQPKLDQLTGALSVPRMTSAQVDRRDEWRAWAAGLYDGEGSTYLLNHRSHAGYRIAEARITQGSPLDVPDVLGRFHFIVGVGHINGPYRQEDANLLVYRWTAAAFGDIRTMLTIIWPWLGEVKRSQAGLVCDMIASQPALPRGRAEWGSHKAYCIHGHEYAKTRIRPYVSRGKDLPPRDSEQCLQCAREQARARRLRQREQGNSGGGPDLAEPRWRYLLK